MKNKEIYCIRCLCNGRNPEIVREGDFEECHRLAELWNADYYKGNLNAEYYSVDRKSDLNEAARRESAWNAYKSAYSKEQLAETVIVDGVKRLKIYGEFLKKFNRGEL